MRNNLISKRTGMGDHMMSNEITDIIFPHAQKYIDIINDEGDLGQCIKNQYVTIEWIKKLIELPQWQYVGKKGDIYEYFVDDGNIMKPTLTNVGEEPEDDEILYKRATGDTQFDFDDLGDEQIEDLKQAFIICSKKNPSFHWYEYSWSHANPEHDLSGCHIRVFANLRMKTKIEWGFWYLHLLNAILRHVSDKNRDTIMLHIDWSCCSITRGFAIPYNEGGVLMGEKYDEDKIIGIENEDLLDKLFQEYSCSWYDEIYNKFIKKFIKPKKRKELISMGLISENEDYKYRYSQEQDWIFDENHKIVSGEIYNYNWRLSLVTTLMGVFNKDTEIVRNICSVIYRYIEPYKNHSYDEMLYDELENKIFKRANFDLEPNHTILKELWDDWGLKITIRPNIK